jgi:AbiV family abortive infection protein
MSRTKLDQYSGPLQPDQVAQGISVASENARDLLADAEVLLERGSYPRAAALAALAIEEAGKDHILRGLAVTHDETEQRKAWKAYRTHTRKNVMWIFPELVISGARHLDEFKSLVEDDAEHPRLLDRLKQMGFYTDCLGDAQWTRPRDVVDEDLARTLVAIARVFARGKTVTTREIELWVEHVGPVWRHDMNDMKKAAAKWHEAMQAEGLKPPDEGRFEKFLFGAASEEQEPSRSGA